MSTSSIERLSSRQFAGRFYKWGDGGCVSLLRTRPRPYRGCVFLKWVTQGGCGMESRGHLILPSSLPGFGLIQSLRATYIAPQRHSRLKGLLRLTFKRFLYNCWCLTSMFVCVALIVIVICLMLTVVSCSV